MISIVTAYYNRRELFFNTLSTLKYSAVKDIEVIAVDDGSNEENRLEDLQEIFPFLKVIRLETADKWYVNSCIPFNKGFEAAKGDIILIQNPECAHYGDVISYAAQNLKPNDYISFGAYSLDKPDTNRLTDAQGADPKTLGIHFLERAITTDGESGWYNQSLFRPKGYHWCCAIHKNDLEALGGFDGRYAMGVAFDDNELLARIQKKRMNYRIVDEPFVLHQNHFQIDDTSNKSINPWYSRKEAKLLWEKNEYLYNEYTLKRKSWRAPKRSKLMIKSFDIFLSYFLKFKHAYAPLKWRVQNKMKRILHRAY